MKKPWSFKVHLMSTTVETRVIVFVRERSEPIRNPTGTKGCSRSIATGISSMMGVFSRDWNFIALVRFSGFSCRGLYEDRVECQQECSK
ncbi:hypothetical protein V6N13_140689 [Hibiscus sabdariffa]